MRLKDKVAIRGGNESSRNTVINAELFKNYGQAVEMGLVVGF